MVENMMRAVMIDKITDADEVALENYAIPKVKNGWVLIKVKSFGMNHSEKILRLHEIEADYIMKPIIPGIECAGVIEDPSDSQFKKGQRVVSLMGGMGRSFNGSYADYVLVPENQVFEVNKDISWEYLGAVPETYYTAWGSLFNGLCLKKGDTLLIRGATCALGYASIQLAKAFGCKVIATTHKEEKIDLLKAADVDEFIVDNGKLSDRLSGISKVLELVGPKTLKDSLRLVKDGGIVCHTGILGGVFTLNGFDPIKDIPNGVYLTGFYSNYPTQTIMNEIFNFIAEHRLKPCVGKTFNFEEISQACLALDNGSVNGKIVVNVNE